MLLPVGHDQTELRRWPVVSCALIGACLAVQLVAANWAPQGLSEISARRDECIGQVLRWPDLEPDPALKPWLPARPRPAMSLPGRARRQARLDACTRQWLASLDALPAWRWGYVPARPRPARWLTYIFVHANLLHLLVNLLFLYLTGPFLEDRWGRGAFLALFLGGGAAAAMGHHVAWPNSVYPLVGASGAIAALMGAFLVRFPRARIRFVHPLSIPYGTVTAPAWLMLPLWAGLELARAWYHGRAADVTAGAVAYGAHVAGFFWGMAAGWLAGRLGVEERVARRVDERLGRIRDRALAAANRALVAGRLGEAHRILGTRILARPDDRDAAEAFLSVTARLDGAIAGSGLGLRVIRALLRAGQVETALAIWEEVRSKLPAGLPPQPALELAAALWGAGERPGAVALLQRVAGAADLRRVDGPTLAALTELAAAAEPALAARLGAAAASHPGIPRAERERIRALLQRRAS